ncbi:unnamed protein product [Dimorphilus gyrociliatus]|uniref:SIPAR domain-containing protein n=1 Tax=Dimorphilus gyrociliatus TaxID=2664684 RepID=A0A7I8VZ68_9ANNE|nr:unnamed protein product [Dimorphilus gyrociliatus]
MSRSIRDLRELICISRLSFIDESADEGLGIGSASSTPPLTPRHSSPDSGTAVVTPPPYHLPKPPPLPPVKRTVKLDDVLAFVDTPLLSEWLDECNEKVDDMVEWIRDNFVHFAHFWLTDFPDNKKVEIMRLEVGIVSDSMRLLFKSGLQHGKLSGSDIGKIMEATLKEYPKILLSSQFSFIFLDYLNTLTSGRTDEYRKLLSDVTITTKVRTHAQAALGLRAYTIVNVWFAVVSFFRQITSYEPQKLIDSKNALPLFVQRAFYSINLGFIDVIHYLITTKKINIKVLDNSGRSLAFIAAMKGQTDILRLLLKFNCNINIASKSGNTPLHAAVTAGSEKIVRILCKQPNIEINARNKECGNCTPLHSAVLQGHEEIVKMLIKYGADKSLKANGQTPLELANDLDHSHLIKVLKSN